MREGSLDAPTRHPVDWRGPDFYDQQALDRELERVFDICHGCRRCVSLCNAFPTLFDLVDESDTLEVDGVAKGDYVKVVDQCYLCDLCYMTKCPYVPPHPWNVDFPHLMLRAKAVKFKQGKARFRDRFLSGTDTLGKLVTLIPAVDLGVNAVNRNTSARKLMSKHLGIHPDASLPQFRHRTARRRARSLVERREARASGTTTGKVALFTTCYGNYYQPEVVEDLIRVFQHNDIDLTLAPREQCCGMPKLELGDIEAVVAAGRANIPVLAKLVDEGYDLVAPIPSCVLMFKQELPLLLPEDPEVQKVKEAMYDPFEYLMLRHKAGLLNTDFQQPLGDVSYQVACHLRVQNIGLKTRDLLNLVPGTEVHAIERCSGHDGTYAVRNEFRDAAVKIATPVARKVDQQNPQHLASDCPMAARMVADVATLEVLPEHPMGLLRKAYGL
ncbi:MAG: heterodisulfide reductase-related iron-sulfur binding cluster [Porticoccaceae bacterium]|jgi:Fe-S oxidoreductase|nr:heterodisulfide reductase-related iron-sulfur binding cluster [Porticoccaceae bacterium]